MKAEKYYIKFNGQFVEKFFKTCPCVTDNQKSAGIYSKKTAEMQIAKRSGNYELIPVN
jgi:hypothetical protein